MKARLLSVCVVLALVSMGVAAPVQGQDLRFGVTLLNGDANGDLKRDVSDGVFLLSHLFKGGPPLVPMATCDDDPAPIENGDANGDSALDISDAIYFLHWLYTGGPEPVQPCGDGSGASANATTSAVVIDPGFPAPRVNPCNGDVIIFGGKIIAVNHMTTRPDGTIQLVFIASWANLTGTGIPSGTEYKVLGGARIVFNFGPGAMTTSAVSQERLVTAGGEPNGSVQFNIQTTINANGDVTVNFTDVDFVCHGD